MVEQDWNLPGTRDLERTRQGDYCIPDHNRQGTDTPPRPGIRILDRGSTDNANDVCFISGKYTGKLDAPKVSSKSRCRKIYELGILGTGALAVSLKTKKRKKIKPFDFINITKLHTSTNKIKKLYLRLLSITLLL